jgi:hypothetical protein
MSATPISFVLLLLLASAAGAQSLELPEHEWSRGTTLGVLAGVSAASSTEAPLAGGAFGWEFGPWVGVEGSGAWLRRGRGASAFAASMAGHLNLTRPRAAVPFVKAGVGLYRAWFDTGRASLPEFYRDRIRAADTRPSFTDPAFVLGGGANLYATPRWAVRPQAEALFVRRHGSTYTLALVSVHVTHHFERHTVRPRATAAPARP